MSRNPPAGQGCTVGNYLIHYRLFQKQYWDGYRGPTVNLPMIATSGNIPPPFPYVTQGGGHRGASISVKAICRANALWGVPQRARVRGDASGDVQESRQAGHRRRRRRRRLPMGNHQLSQVAACRCPSLQEASRSRGSKASQDPATGGSQGSLTLH